MIAAEQYPAQLCPNCRTPNHPVEEYAEGLCVPSQRQLRGRPGNSGGGYRLYPTHLVRRDPSYGNPADEGQSMVEWIPELAP